MKRFIPLLISLGGGILLWASWPVSPLGFLVFVAWLPLLWVEDQTKSWKKLLGYTYLHMLCWNVLTTWWVANSTLPGALGAFFANSLLMCLPWLLMHYTKKRLGRGWGSTSLILFWISFEFIHHNWELSWPWLTLGNAFATHTEWVQWYEYLGTSGGTLWVLLSNILLYAAFTEYRNRGRSAGYLAMLAGWLLLLVIPILVSRSLLNRALVQVRASLDRPAPHVVIVQPNIDPWDEKFEAGSQEAQLQKLIALSEKQLDSQTALVVWPETAIPFQSDESDLHGNFFLRPLWAFLQRHPSIHLLTGLEGIRYFPSPHSRYSLPVPGTRGLYYEGYNSALLMDSNKVAIYHKSKLVPGVETLPGFLRFLDKLFEKFGGTTSGYARNSGAEVLAAADCPYRVAPAVCYESIYGDYLTGFMRKGANLICVITNDGWWGDTPGYRQHMNYARLRAIESRTWVVRSANTGISCFIDPTGQVLDPQPWNRATSIRMEVPAAASMTFYTRHGDLLSRGLLVASILLLAVDGVLWILHTFFHR
ncbi:MAG TPA: apolipoprotein N-acyltransferase [Chitinophagaceae bacterium]|nr:apolipoprotein N-acyltransferase [Chitinophagaceae bacterium]